MFKSEIEKDTFIQDGVQIYIDMMKLPYSLAIMMGCLIIGMMILGLYEILYIAKTPVEIIVLIGIEVWTLGWCIWLVMIRNKWTTGKWFE